MKIAYLGQMADIATENGISKKIRAQTLQWIAAGHEVRYFSLTARPETWHGLIPLKAELVLRGSVPLRVMRSYELVRRIRAWTPDLVYFRYAYHSPGFPRLFREIPTVAEINSDDLSEYPLTLSLGKLLYHRLTRQRVLRACDALIAVTHELAGRFANIGIDTTVIANGVDFSAIEPAPALHPSDDYRLAFIGNTGSPWHGLTRLEAMVRLAETITIDVVGCTEQDWHMASQGRPVPERLRFHGMLPQSAYEPILRRATAAIGTLGLFHKRMNEACPLKVREYLAAGLPVIAGYTDTDIPESADYFLRLPNSESPLDPYRERLLTFLSYWNGRRVPRSSIAHLDISVKERERIAFLERFANRNPS